MLLHPHQPSYPPLFNLSYEPLDEDKKEIRVLRLLNMHSSDLMEDKIQCRIEHVSLKDLPVFPSISEHPDSQENFIFWGPFTECIDFRESFLERTEISKAASIARAHNIVYPNFRYTWGGFEALSYTWGNKKDTKEITVNGVDINVPKNLEEALKTLRDLEETRLGMSYWVDSLCINQNCEDEKEIQVKRMKDIYNQARAVVVWLVQAEAQDKLAAETMHYICQNPCVFRKTCYCWMEDLPFSPL
ncbi:hypothetical protein yc1106_07292 [Curvularia clavata]|uniref:Heterokaryon incompatibility domain-containing protein n=1 Tax=Curvularia clavata TaxID=95742 RepID=A0A9Q9DTM6_CURCL|nr:hypothetical protein yc1106_07292 [Curvularia clavata]